MKAKLNYTNIGPRITVSEPLTSHISAQYLLSLSPRQRSICVYKRLYKLRFMIGDSLSQQDDYHNLLKRKIRCKDFNIRRNIMLDVDEQLSEESLCERLANTYAFVFNATCEPENPIPKVNFHNDLEEALKPRLETSILQTILMMERETPPAIKFDRKYSWVGEVRRFYASISEDMPAKEFKKLVGKNIAHHVGFLQYEQTLAYLNETMKLCL